MPNAFDQELKNNHKIFKAFLRLAAAHYELDATPLLWYHHERNPELPFSQKSSFSHSNRHFSRASNIAYCILNLEDEALKNALLTKIYNESDKKKVFSLYNIFNEINVRLSGLGLLRTLYNPPGISRGNVVGFVVGAGIGTATSAGVIGVANAAVFTGGALSGFLDIRPKMALYYHYALKNAYKEASLATESIESAATTNADNDSAPKNSITSAYQRWMFEPRNDLGKKITELMLELNQQSLFFERNFPSLISDILSELKNYSFEEQKEFLSLPLTTHWYGDNERNIIPRFMKLENNGIFTFRETLINIIDNPEAMQHFFALIDQTVTYSSGESDASILAEDLKMLILHFQCCPALLKNAEFKTRLNEKLITATNRPNAFIAIFETFIDHHGKQPSLTELDQWIKKFPKEMQAVIFKDFLTQESLSSEMSSWLKKQWDSKPTLKRWIALSMAYDASVFNDLSTQISNIMTRLNTPEAVRDLPSHASQEDASPITQPDTELTIEDIIELLSGNGPSSVTAADNRDNDGGRSLLYSIKAEAAGNKEQIISIIQQLSYALRMRCYVDITDSTTSLGRFFDSRRGDSKPSKTGGSRAGVPAALKQAERECIDSFYTFHSATLNAEVKSIINKRLFTQESGSAYFGGHKYTSVNPITKGDGNELMIDDEKNASEYGGL